MKKSLKFLVLLAALPCSTLLSQSGQKWATGGNGLSTGDFLGSTNSFPVIFKTNNLQRACLSATGIFQINNLSGTGTRLVTTDASGNISYFNWGTSSQVLYGNGTWGSLPALQWTQSGSNIYYNTGKVGIGNNNPTFPLDVTGNTRITGSLTATSINSTSLAGSGTRLLTTDATGDISFLNSGTSSQVLFGNGTWGNLPVAPSTFWNASGSNIYYNAGTVGVGTTTPNTAYSLDVIGDARISNDLWVGGGVIITDKVNATSAVTSRSLNTDSIFMDSSRAIIGATRIVGTADISGNTKISGDAKVSQQLSVTGNTKLSGDLNMNGKFYMGGTQLAMDYGVQGVSQKVFSFGGPVSVLSVSCATPTLNTPANYQFNGTLQTWGNAFNGGQLNVMDIGFDGNAHFIEGAGSSNSNPKTPLLVNYYCGNDIYLNTGATPGFVGTGPNLEVGFPQRNNGVAVNINAPNKTGLFINSQISTPFGYASQIQVDNDLTKTFSINNVTGTAYESFLVYGDGTTKIGTLSHGGKLNVDGTIYAKEVKVTLANWADYVFESNYKLLPLKAVEKYIKIHKHLPGVPSEKEMVENGNSLAETDKMFMRKIEELTLYNIGLEKEVAELKKEMQEIKALLKKD